MFRTYLWIPAVLLAASLTPACALDLAISTQNYGTSGLFTNPLIPGEKEIVKITVRATIAGDMPAQVAADIGILAPDGTARHYPVQLTPGSGQATGTLEWKAWQNGLYRVVATLDPDNALAETNEQNNVASLDLPVVVPGRRPHFPWFAERDCLRWATIWAGAIGRDNIARWQERGVLPLAWKWGTNLPGEWSEDRIYEMMLNFGEASGGAVDECGYYPTPEGIERFQTYMRGMARAKKELPDKFFMMWHSGSFYPEQAALYRGACDLVVLESYVFWYAATGLYTENIYDYLDMKMLPARQVDMLGATGRSRTQVITSVDLKPGAFNRGLMENVIRHLRRKWPEMRGFGIYGGLVDPKAQAGEQAQGRADEQFVDRLCFEYFVKPVVTILPENIWVTRGDDGRYLVEAAVSNIGGMDSGPVSVALYADGRPLKTTRVKTVPAGDTIFQNQVRVTADWHPQAGSHELQVRLDPAPGSTVLDAEAGVGYYTR